MSHFCMWLGFCPPPHYRNMGAWTRGCGHYAPPCGAALEYIVVDLMAPATVAFVVKKQVLRAMLRIVALWVSFKMEIPNTRCWSARVHTPPGEHHRDLSDLVLSFARSRSLMLLPSFGLTCFSDRISS